MDHQVIFMHKMALTELVRPTTALQKITTGVKVSTDAGNNPFKMTGKLVESLNDVSQASQRPWQIKEESDKNTVHFDLIEYMDAILDSQG
jgi:hypothetical protein